MEGRAKKVEDDATMIWGGRVACGRRGQGQDRMTGLPVDTDLDSHDVLVCKGGCLLR